MAETTCAEVFNNLTSRISHLFIERSKGDWKVISKTLEELNSLNYRQPIVKNPTKAVLLINHCCSYIPADEEIVIPKCCQLITNLLNFQKVSVEGRTLFVAIQWCLQILKVSHSNKDILLDVLKALDALLRTNSQNIEPFLSDIASLNGPILKIIEDDISQEILRYSLQCLESCTIRNLTSEKTNTLPYRMHFDKCFHIFMKYLLNPRDLKDVSELKILIVCLRGLENIILHNYDVSEALGKVLGIIKSYMLLGMKNGNFIEPKALLPSTLSIPETPANGIREKKGGKVTKQRRQRISKKDEIKTSEEWIDTRPNSLKVDVLSNNFTESFRLQLTTSDSDFSDGGSNKEADIFKLQSRVRQVSLSLFFSLAKVTDKRIMFSFWSSFIPDNSLLGKHYLTTCILEDPSPRGRTAALNVLLYMLTSFKLYLFQAESSNQSSSFTPFSVTLGYMIIELHRHLSLALSEKVVPVLAQVLKCYAALVQATPYHRLNAGLVTKVIRSMRYFMQYRDSTIQVGALIVLGCIIASEPVVPETKLLLLKTESLGKMNGEKKVRKPDEEDFEYAEFSSDEDDYDYSETATTLPWVLEKCLMNLNNASNTSDPKALPVKLESLQVISCLCRNYFDDFVYRHMSLIGKTLNECLCNKQADLKLHAGRTIDSIGQAMEHYLGALEVCDDGKVTPGLLFWHLLINGSLTSLLQSEEQAFVKAVGCDCLGSIGSHIFERLPTDKQILCVTLLFACSRDEESSVRAAALRALGISVLYPTLREDPGFVVDTAEAIYRSLGDENIGVRIKSSWSLGNFSDALVVNKLNENLEQLPNSLLLKIFDKSIAACSDNEKIKMNAVRTIGNLLQLITPELKENTDFKNVVRLAVDCLIKAATTGSNKKVRWNACYAVGSALKNHFLYEGDSKCIEAVYEALNNLVINFRNFKVRINAALALSAPSKRKYYGIHYHLTWKALLKALDNSQNIEEYHEYQHRDHLVQQICLTLAHLVSLLEVDDLPSLHESLNSHFDVLKMQIKRVYEILIPEKSSILFSASVHLKSLNTWSMNSEASDAFKMLTDVFVHEF